jgi:hypothetical protein
MPEFKLPAVKLPGFRDMTTDDIRQTLSDVPRPEIKLSEIADAAAAATQAAAQAAADAAASVAQIAAERNPRRQRASRRPMVVAGIFVTVLGLIALANAGWIRARLSEMGQRARQRMDAERVDDSLERLGDEDAYTNGVGISVEPEAYADTLPSATPAGMTPEPVAYEASAFERSDVEGNAPYGDAGIDAEREAELAEENRTRLYGG